MTSKPATPIRRIVLGLVLACSLLPASSSSAVQPAYTLSVDVTPNMAGTAAAPAPVTLTLHTTIVPKPADPPFGTTNVSFVLDPGIAIGVPGAGVCRSDQVQSDATGCVPIGDGSIRMSILGITEDLAVSVYRGTARQEVLLLVSGDSPLRIHSVWRLAGTAVPAGGTTLDSSVPASLQQPAPGAYATFSHLVVSLRSTVGLVGCPPALALNFATRSDFTDGSSAEATTVTPCTAAPPAPVVDVAPARPLFATQLARQRGAVLGKLLGLASVRRMTVGKVSLRCDVGCRRHALGSKQLRGTERSTLIRLHPAVNVTRRTRISVVMVDASERSRTQRFRFVRRPGGLVAKRV
jgi:hypothetical protein